MTLYSTEVPEIVFVAFGSYGDINPLLAIAASMINTRRVLFIANEYYRDSVNSYCVPFVQAGYTSEQLKATETNISNGDTAEGSRNRFHNIIGVNYSRVYEIIKEIYLKNRNICVVTHGNVSPAVPVCEKYRIPIIMAYYAPYHMPNNIEDYILFETYHGANRWLAKYYYYPIYLVKNAIFRPYLNDYNKYRKQLGIRPKRSAIAEIIVMVYTRIFKRLQNHDSELRIIGELALCPKWFCDPIGNDIKHIQYCGFTFVEPHTKPSDELDKFIELHGSPVVFTPGTAVEDIEEFISQIIPTCKLLKAPGILVSAHGKKYFDNLVHQDVPLLHLEQANFEQLLPQSKLLVHHGGIGTIAQAIKAAVPQIVRPRMYDQPGNAIRVALNGLGGFLYPSDYTADNIAHIFEFMKNSELHQDNLRFYADEVSNEDGIGNAVRFIELWMRSLAVSDTRCHHVRNRSFAKKFSTLQE